MRMHVKSYCKIIMMEATIVAVAERVLRLLYL